MKNVLTTVILLFACGLSHAAEADAPTFTPQDLEFFETKIRPVLADSCYSCHSHEAKRLKGGFYLDSRAAMIDGALAEPGDPDASMMIEAVRYKDPTNQMPPKGKLPDAVIADLEKWVQMGMPWPTEATPGDGEKFDLQGRKQSHWAWHAPKRSERIPQRGILDTNAMAIDFLVEERLAKEGLEPGPPADRATLIRRVTLDLTGLPPTPEEIDAFVNDNTPGAYEALVDRLLASPRYGEKWGRHWLDLVRYAETYGHEFDYEISHAWKYRDYVIRAINDDVPYDRFVREHVAGDLIEPRIHKDTQVNEAVKATGWWYMHEQTHSPTDVRQHESERFDNQIDVVSKTFMGMTVACARCHDHKFDAISEDDYYALVGYMQSSRQHEAYLDPGGKIAQSLDRVREVRAKGQAALDAMGIEKAKATTIDHADSRLFEDFNAPSFNGWLATGWAWDAGPTVPGQWDALGGRSQVMPGVAHSGLLGDQAMGALRSPEFELKDKQVWLRVKGKGQINLIIDSYTMNAHNQLLFEGLRQKIDTKGQWQWVVLNDRRGLYAGKGNHRAHLELIDDHADAHLMVDEVRFSSGAKPPEPNDPALEIVAPQVESLDTLTEQFAQAAGKTPKPERALAMTDGSPEDSYVHVRGAWQSVGATVPRRSLTALGGEEMPAAKESSGRDALANAMTTPTNPLTARVQVNRLWHHLFGVGIVPTVDNLGYLGLPASHPELLDHLAVMFVEDDAWSNKAMIKRIVMSKAYQRASDRNSPAIEEKDPNNVLLHRQNIRRMTAEILRDSILAVSGSLNEKQFGPPISPYLTDFMQGRGRPKSGPLDGDGRRSIYIGVRRNFLPPMMLTFDTPIPFSTVGKRNESNVPAQSLTLMNDPFVHDQSDKWAARLVKDGKTQASERITAMFVSTMGRKPMPAELDASLKFVQSVAEQLGVPKDAMMADARLWRELCHAMFNLKGFVYVR